MTDPAALTLGIVATVLAAVSLGWQIASHVLTGGRARTDLKVGALGMGGAVTAPFDRFQPSSLQSLIDQGYEEPVLAVEVTNHGRFPVEVANWSVGFESGASYSHPAWQVNPPLPHRLEGGTSKTFYCPLALVQNASRALAEVTKRPHSRVRAQAALSTGKQIRSRWYSF